MKYYVKMTCTRNKKRQHSYLLLLLPPMFTKLSCPLRVYHISLFYFPHFRFILRFCFYDLYAPLLISFFGNARPKEVKSHLLCFMVAAGNVRKTIRVTYSTKYKTQILNPGNHIALQSPVYWPDSFHSGSDPSPDSAAGDGRRLCGDPSFAMERSWKKCETFGWI